MTQGSQEFAEVDLSNAAGCDRLADLWKLIERSAAISFDFFDTLFVRPLSKPEDAFELIGAKLGIANFSAMRLSAQAEAFRRMHAEGRREIRLDDIYTCMAGHEVDAHELMEVEYELELELVRPNPEMVTVFRKVVTSGKPVVITSDMYLPSAYFTEILRRHSLPLVPIYVSCEKNATKRDSGELFDVVLEDLNVAPAELLHIGDNEIGDVKRPREKGLLCYHYCSHPHTTRIWPTESLACSVAQGLLRSGGTGIAQGSFEELGFCYGGPAMLGFAEWIAQRSSQDAIDHILFLSRDGYGLERISRRWLSEKLPTFHYFYGSRTAFTLAAMDDANFCDFIPFLLSGSHGLAPRELLERIGVQPPDEAVMQDLGLGSMARVGPELYETVCRFLYAYRWEILKVCQRNRHSLYRYMRDMGLAEGHRVAVVDVGWSGTTQEAFEIATQRVMKLDVMGYYFCLADTPERRAREQKQRMVAMITSASTSEETVRKLHAGRVRVEQFFSAPHDSVIGYEHGQRGIRPVEDPGRGASDGLRDVADQIIRGAESFVERFVALRDRIGFSLPPVQTAMPLIELVLDRDHTGCILLDSIRNFDAWGSSRNHGFSASDYL